MKLLYGGKTYESVDASVYRTNEAIFAQDGTKVANKERVHIRGSFDEVVQEKEGA